MSARADDHDHVPENVLQLQNPEHHEWDTRSVLSKVIQ